MINIAHVKKYEQVPSCYSGFKFLKKLLIVMFLVLPFTVSTKSVLCESAKNTTLGMTSNTGELPLEVSEKYYKKESILKFNEAVKNWELKNINEAIKLWEEAINLDSNLWVAYLGLGQAYDGKKEYKKSLDAYNNYLKFAPKQAPDRKTVLESVKYLTYLLRHGEEAIKGDNYLSLVKTKHQGKEHYVRWDLSSPLKIYFYPANGVLNYRNEFQDAFLEGAELWQEILPGLKFEVLDNTIPQKLSGKKAKEKEKEIIDESQIKIIFPSRFKVKGDPTNPLAAEIDAQSFPIIRDKKNFRVLGVIMISPYIYFQSQIAIPLEPLSKLTKEEQIKKLQIISAREVGHALGLWGFSPNPDDLMFEGEVKELKLSQRDKNTMKKLYELDPEEENLVTNK